MNQFMKRTGMVLAWVLAMACKDALAQGKVYDVVVYGATPGGITSAIAAARQHKQVVLLEPGAHLGGIIAEGLGGTDIDNHAGFSNHNAVGGLALEFYKRVASKYGWLDSLEYAIAHNLKKPAFWRYEPHVAEQVLDEWVKEHDIAVMRNFLLDRTGKGVSKTGNKINSVTSTNGIEVRGKIFIDATVEGDLLSSSGITMIVGREDNRQYNEERNGVRELTANDKLKVKIDPFVIKGDPSSGLIPGIEMMQEQKPGTADHRIQAFCFRICLTAKPESRRDIPKPSGYDRNNYALYLRYLEAGGNLGVPGSNIPNGKTDFNGGADLSHNLYGGHYRYPEGTYEERAKIIKNYREFTQGLLYFYTNDSAVARIAPAFQQRWKQLGLTKDEFTDNDGWPRQFYVRDGRRMVSDLVLTENHIKDKDAVPVADPVALVFWPPDLHAVRRVWHNGDIYNEGAVFGGQWWKPFGIPYKSLVPKKSEAANLLTPTCISSSHIAYGAVRIEWTFMAMGQACGIAAAMAAGQNYDVQDVPYDKLAQALLKNGAVIDLADPLAENYERGGLPNFFKKLKNGKPVTVAFIGGSITRASEQYRQPVMEQLKELYPEIKFSEVVAGIPGTDADLGVFRVDDQVISKKPDLVFIEFAVNGGHPAGAEGIIRKIWKARPQTDICLIYTVTTAQANDYRLKQIPPHILVLDKLADHYRIPSIHFGVHVSSLIRDGRLLPGPETPGNKGIPAFTKDGTHPTVEGGKAYASSVIRAFREWRDHSRVMPSRRDHLPVFNPDNWQNTIAIEPAQLVKGTAAWQVQQPGFLKDYWNADGWIKQVITGERKDSVLQFRFNGTQLGFFDIGGPEAGQLKVNVDGKTTLFNRFNKYCNNRYRGQYFFMDLPAGDHTVELSVSDEMPDKKIILGAAQLEDINKHPEKYDRGVIYIGKILLRGRLLK